MTNSVEFRVFHGVDSISRLLWIVAYMVLVFNFFCAMTYIGSLAHVCMLGTFRSIDVLLSHQHLSFAYFDLSIISIRKPFNCINKHEAEQKAY